jgi:hypothetical protein
MQRGDLAGDGLFGYSANFLRSAPAAKKRLRPMPIESAKSWTFSIVSSVDDRGFERLTPILRFSVRRRRNSASAFSISGKVR